MKALQSIAVVFSLMMISQAAGQESTDEQKAFAGHWALEMSNGAAGWLALELTEDKAEGHDAWREKRPAVFKGR